VRACLRIFVPVFIFAATCAAASAHVAIDVLGDFMLTHDTYDAIGHDSRELVTLLAIVAAGVAALRGVRACIEHAQHNRGRLVKQVVSRRVLIAGIPVVATLASAIVPAMETLDGILAHAPVDDLGDAFGGSIALGLTTTLVCAVFATLGALLLVRALVAHRDAIAIMLERWLHPHDAARRPAACERDRFAHWVPHLRTPRALRRCKRGPPPPAVSDPYCTFLIQQGALHVPLASATGPNAARVRARACALFADPHVGGSIARAG
jgi:hypothetical protein